MNINFNIKKYALLILLAVVVVFVILYLIFYIKPTLKNEAEIEIFAPTTTPQVIIDSEDLFITAEKCKSSTSTKDLQLCQARATSTLATSKKDLFLCLDIDDFSVRQQCIYDIANILNDARMCNKIANRNSRENCLEMKSLTVLDEKYCNTLSDDDQFLKKVCFDRFEAFRSEKTGDINSCTKIKSIEYGNLCMQKAFKKGATCDDISDIEQRNNCKSRNIFALVKSNKDCEKIPSLDYRKVCESAFRNMNIKDYRYDDDGDGLNNDLELWISTDPFKSDTDSDGITDFDEFNKYKTDPSVLDDNSTTLTRADDYYVYNFAKTESDCESMEKIENKIACKDHILSSNNYDFDKDGINNDKEIWLNLNPTIANSSNDLLAKIAELKSSPKGSNTDTSAKMWWNEFQPYDPLDNTWRKDSDADGLIDIDEVFYETDSYNKDSDGDGSSDFEEISELKNPRGEGLLDFDFDGLSDKEEIKQGTNRNMPDTNGDGLVDSAPTANSADANSTDVDSDKLTNGYELKIGTNPLEADTDKDGFEDGAEVVKGYNPCGDGKLPTKDELLVACKKYLK